MIDSQEGEVLRELYDMILSKLYQEKHEEEPLSLIEKGYREMEAIEQIIRLQLDL